MKLQNGYEVVGTIDIPTMIRINDEWVNVLIIETAMDATQASALFINNSSIVDTGDTSETIYFTDGLLDVKVANGKTYVWLKYIASNVNQLLQPQLEALQKQLTDVTTALASLVGGV
jgi:hypothetical protein